MREKIYFPVTAPKNTKVPMNQTLSGQPKTLDKLIPNMPLPINVRSKTR